MAKIHVVHSDKNGNYPEPGTILPGEPYERPFITLADGRMMTYEAWRKAGSPE